MLNEKKTDVRILDYAILVFSLIFVLSLSNSIFVNQIGYFFTLIFLLIRYAVTRENQFRKTGLEIAFLLYLLAEILSTIFSDHFSDSFQNLTKRVILILIVYTVIAATTDLKRGKLFLKLYIAGTIITVLIYLYLSFDYFINNIYNITQSGPSLFQYPITASEIMSFTVIFMFAFLVNEKTNIKTKLFLFAGFLISALALFATYKRTGWIGAAFGILVILIVRKQWKMLITCVILLVMLLQFENNISELVIYDASNSDLKELSRIKTEGRANHVFHLDNYKVVSDYENGISIYKNSVLIKNLPTPAPVISFSHFKGDLFLASLVDTRFLVLRKDSLNFIVVDEIIPPGYTVNYKIANGLLYVLDSDSGLTIYEFKNEGIKIFKYPQFGNYKFLFVDSLKIYLSSVDSGLSVYALEKNLPGKRIYSDKKKNLEYLFHGKDILIASYPDGIIYFKTDNEQLRLLSKIGSINNVRGVASSDSGFYIIKGAGELIELKLTENDFLEISRTFNLGFIPNSTSYINGKLYLTKVKRSRLLSIFDPYIPSNFNRIALWRAGFEIFKDHPLFGVGDIDLAEYYKQYKRPFDKEIQGHMHNNFIHFLVTLGLFGLLALLFLFARMIIIDYKIYKDVKDQPFHSSLALGTLAACCGFLASGLTELNFWDHEIQTMVWFTFGLNIALFLLSKKESRS